MVILIINVIRSVVSQTIVFRRMAILTCVIPQKNQMNVCHQMMSIIFVQSPVVTCAEMVILISAFLGVVILMFVILVPGRLMNLPPSP